MKRPWSAALLAATVSILPASADAQFTIKAGVSFASTTESDYFPDVDSRTGFAIGAGYGFRFGGIFELRPEAFFVQKGGKVANVGTLEVNELNIPLLAQFNLPIPVLAPYAYAGPQGEFELDCTVADTDCVDSESFRWGAVAGAGVRLGGTFSIEGRFNWTLDEIADDIGSKPRTILLLLGLSF